MRGTPRAVRRTAGLTASIAGLLAGYAPVKPRTTRRSSRAAGQRPFPPTRLLGIALTDTFARVAVETFAEIADTTTSSSRPGSTWRRSGRWSASARRVAGTRARAAPVRRGEPRARSRRCARRTSLHATYAYEATTDRAVEHGAGLRPRRPAGLQAGQDVPDARSSCRASSTWCRAGLRRADGAADAGRRRSGSSTSKDAWMPDVIDKLDQAHVDVLVQPEFFVGDTVGTAGHVGAGQPQGVRLLRAAARTRRSRRWRSRQMTGNVFDFSADAQQAIAVKPRSVRRPAAAAVRRAAAGARARRGRPLGGAATRCAADEPMRQRRAAAGGGGGGSCSRRPAVPAAATKPGPCRDGQVEGVVFADVEVGDARRYTRARRGAAAVRRSPAAGPSSRSRVRPAQRRAGCARAQRVLAVFERAHCRRQARDQIYARPLARRRPALVAPRASHRARGRQRRRMVAVRRGRPGRRRSGSRGRTTRPRLRASTSATRERRPAFARLWRSTRRRRPVVAAEADHRRDRRRARGDRVDRRARPVRGRGRPAAGERLLREVGPGEAARAIRLDDTGGHVGRSPPTLDNDWAPSIAAAGDGVVVAWLDFRAYDWDVVLARVERRREVVRRPAARERHAGRRARRSSRRPRGGLGPDGPLVAFTDYRKRADADTALSPHQLYDTFVASPGGANRRVDGARRRRRCRRSRRHRDAARR